MGRALGEYCKWLCLAAALAGVLSAKLAAQEDPPSRVARLNFVTGNVSMQPPGTDEWGAAEINHPFTIGDYLYTDVNSRAELHTDEAAIRMGSQTSFGFLNLNDLVTQIKLTGGDMSFRIHDLPPNQVVEVDTPNAAVQLIRDGVYRFRVDPNGNMTFVVVRIGQAQISGQGQSFALDQGNSAQLNGTDQLTFDVEGAPPPDEFDDWCAGRDAREAQLAATRYVPPTVIGSEDLATYGDWQPAPEYGPVWYPRGVPAGWAPYQVGHWAWVEPWGWTWVDAAPWGFAPFHYGRWAYIGNRWGWCPGPIAVGYGGPVVRPYYAPALVAWFGGSHWGVGITSGGPSLGWVALGFGEVFTPAYHCSRPYFSNVNVYNTRVVKTVNITNVYNTVYVNKTVYNQQFINSRAPNAVYSMRQSAFASGQPVRQGGTVVPQAQFEQLRSSGAVISPTVAPQRQALYASNTNRTVARPNLQVVSRSVVAVQPPASVPGSFQARQQYLQSHTDAIHDFAAMHQQIAAKVPITQAAIVRVDPRAQNMQVQPGQRIQGSRSSPQQPTAATPAQSGQPFNSRPPGNPRTQPTAPPVSPVQADRARERDQPGWAGTPQSSTRGPQNNPPTQRPEAGRSPYATPSQPSTQPPEPRPRVVSPPAYAGYPQTVQPGATHAQTPSNPQASAPSHEEHRVTPNKPEPEHKSTENKSKTNKTDDHKSQ